MEFRHQPQQLQKQKQSYIPNLMQGVHLLQLNRIELSTYLSNQILENPFVDMPEQESRLIQTAINETASTIEQTTASQPSLFDFLKEQIELFYRKTYLRELLFWWVNQLDHRGYVTKTIEEAMDETGAASVELLDALTLLQQLDPPGVGARDLKECLLLQTERLDFAPSIAYIVIEENLESLINKKWSSLAQTYDVTEADIKEVYQFIKKLTPSPGEAYQASYTPFVLPELSVSIDKDELVISETKYKTPLVSFNQSYFKELSSSDDPQLKSYIKEKKKEYDILQTSLEKRKETILRVGTAIVMHQHTYFKDADAPLVPLQLTDLAEELHLNQSTISRAVRETYIETPYGSKELKTFLSRRSSQSELSKDHILQALQNLIQSEDKAKPLSDQAISDALKAENMTLSRRGVTKYRKQLDIPSSKQRKE
ncbi:RNA polymerase, sigma 54 subunit, RpoN/SigL [Alkalibacterium putridalgicola]|uniref:RNA polymerase sigma-54 factor n=1 Tax=Alkalibacterium putridalgicola TaxID=426703 RepID=A0A1H7XJ65_9LACT|nr:RNA polymerase factor sigma-54 [Alkalibacterium putridalgicola]GEK88709.1 RNA polymerase sigma-54 factor [Alkalibacterium putridalgicola]SEM33952.1 RNA polymerase, sigma 54 subunit, RpoN/SigL [Alkalibacterium putridalgicola]